MRKLEKKNSIKMRLAVAIVSIIAMILASSILLVSEFKSLNSYITGIVSRDFRAFDLVTEFTESSIQYNEAIVGSIGITNIQETEVFNIDSLRRVSLQRMSSLKSDYPELVSDSLSRYFNDFITIAHELEEIQFFSPGDLQEWYKERMYPIAKNFFMVVKTLNTRISSNLSESSASFRSEIYRGLIPGVTALSMSIILLLLLLFYVNSYYISPIYGMRRSLDDYLKYGKNYNFITEGDDQLTGLNDSLKSIVEDHKTLKYRITQLKHNYERKSDK